MVSVCLRIHACARCAFMHGAVLVRCICMCVLFMAKKEALRPAASWSNWHVNHVSVGRISACMCVFCVFVKDLWLISRGNVWPRESCPPNRPAPTLPWPEHGFSLSRRETGQPRNLSFRTIARGRVQIKHFSMCVVMRSCVFVCKLSVGGLLPLVCRLGWAFLFCWCLDVFSCSSSPPTHTHSTLEGNTENKRNPTPSLPRGPPLVMAGWPHSGGCGVTRAGKISCVKTQNDRNGKRKRMKSRRDVKKNKWRTNSCCTVFKKPMPGLDWGSVCVSARVSLTL